MMLTIIVVVKLDKKMLDVKRQFFKSENHVFEKNDSNDTMSSIHSIDDSHCLSNEIVLQLSYEN